MLGFFEKVNLSIPDRLEERSSSKLESSHLFGEYVVSRYSESTTLYISNIPAHTSYPIQLATKKLLSGSYPDIRCVTYSSPFVFSLIGNDVHRLNVETGEVVKMPPAPHTADIATIRSLLVSGTYLAGINLRQIIVWVRTNENYGDLLTSEGSSSLLSTSANFPRDNTQRATIKIIKGENDDDGDDDDYDDDGKEEKDSSENVIIVSSSEEQEQEKEEDVPPPPPPPPSKVINIRDKQESYGCGPIGNLSDFSRFMGNNLLVLVNNNPTSDCAFQIWDISTEDLVGWGSSPALNTMESFITFTCIPAANKIVGSYHSRVYIWDITKFKNEDTKEFQAPTSIAFDQSVVTSLYADESLIITGDNYGSVRMFDVQTSKFIGSLCGDNTNFYDNDNSDDDDDDDDDDEKGFGSPVTAPIGSLAVMFKNKTTKIMRVGRWVLVTFASGRAELHDIFTTDTHEAADFFNPDSITSVKNISAAEICNGKVVFAYTAPKGAAPGPKVRSAQPEIIVWTPRPMPDTFEYYAEFPPSVRCSSLLHMIRCALDDVIARCESNKVELAAHTTKLCEAAAKIDALDRLRPMPPFCFVQDMAEALDFYDFYLGEVAMYRSKVAKNAPLLAEAARKFYISLDLLGSVMDYVGEVNMAYSSPDAVRTAPPLGTGQSAVFSFKRRGLLYEGPSLAETDPRVCMMLSGANATLSELQKIFSMGIKFFDDTCNVAFSKKGPDANKVDSLINVYTKLHELNEDCKETGKDVGDLVGEKQKGKWYEGGGKYRDPDKDLDTSDFTSNQH